MAMEMKKGRWSPEEDAILRTFVVENGEGNWTQIYKRGLLMRSGRSCYFRWSDHLRPNIDKTPITEEEGDRIIMLQARFGNRFAKIAEFFPFRTELQIRNYWNTKAKLKPSPLDQIELPPFHRSNANAISNIITTYEGEHDPDHVEDSEWEKRERIRKGKAKVLDRGKEKLDPEKIKRARQNNMPLQIGPPRIPIEKPDHHILLLQSPESALMGDDETALPLYALEDENLNSIFDEYVNGL